nr:hypothetical protein [Tanacetum cinerariifolium]
MFTCDLRGLLKGGWRTVAIIHVVRQLGYSSEPDWSSSGLRSIKFSTAPLHMEGSEAILKTNVERILGIQKCDYHIILTFRPTKQLKNHIQEVTMVHQFKTLAINNPFVMVYGVANASNILEFYIVPSIGYKDIERASEEALGITSLVI